MPQTVYMPIESPEAGGIIELDNSLGNQSASLLTVSNQRTKRIIDVVLTAMTQVVVGVGGTDIVIGDPDDTNPFTQTLCTFHLDAGTYAKNHRWLIGHGDANPNTLWTDAHGVVAVSPRSLHAAWTAVVGHSGVLSAKVIHQVADGGHQIQDVA